MTTAVWIENTTSRNDHGGQGWEFGKCIWSPATDKKGSAGRYRIMQQVQRGDLVINCCDGKICGQSLAASDCYTMSSRPPNPIPWDYAREFFRFDLEGFQEVEKKVPLATLGASYKDLIRDEITATRPKYYLFSWWPCSEFHPEGRIVVSQGRFLARSTPLISSLINQIAGLNNSLFHAALGPVENRQ